MNTDDKEFPLIIHWNKDYAYNSNPSECKTGAPKNYRGYVTLYVKIIIFITNVNGPIAESIELDFTVLSGRCRGAVRPSQSHGGALRLPGCGTIENAVCSDSRAALVTRAPVCKANHLIPTTLSYIRENRYTKDYIKINNKC